MIALANTVVDVLRGQTTDAYGDPADVDTVVVAGVPISLAQLKKRTTGGKDWSTDDQRPVSGVDRATSHFIGRASVGTDIRDGDRLRVRPAGPIYLVEGVGGSPGVGIATDLRMDLTRVT